MPMKDYLDKARSVQRPTFIVGWHHSMGPCLGVNKKERVELNISAFLGPEQCEQPLKAPHPFPVKIGRGQNNRLLSSVLLDTLSQQQHQGQQNN